MLKTKYPTKDAPYILLCINDDGKDVHLMRTGVANPFYTYLHAYAVVDGVEFRYNSTVGGSNVYTTEQTYYILDDNILVPSKEWHELHYAEANKNYKQLSKKAKIPKHKPNA